MQIKNSNIFEIWISLKKSKKLWNYNHTLVLLNIKECPKMINNNLRNFNEKILISNARDKNNSSKN